MYWEYHVQGSQVPGCNTQPPDRQELFHYKEQWRLFNKIKDLEVPPPTSRKMVVYVSTLFTRMTLYEAIWVIMGRLEKDTSLPERCELSIDQIITILVFCLNSTYFFCDSMFYHQIWGTPMGSLISSGVTNLVMEDFEIKAIDSAPTKLHVWYHYRNDMFTVLHEYVIEEYRPI